MKGRIAIAALSLGAACQAQAQTVGQPQVARLTDTQVLLTTADAINRKLAECQPLRGETVAVLETIKSSPGMPAPDMARVRVQDGRCKDTLGWVGLERVEAAR